MQSQSKIFRISRFSLLHVAASLACIVGQAHAITVTPVNSNFEQLAMKLLVPGWAPVPGSVTATRATTNAIGIFDNAADLGIAEGVLLTTGTVDNAVGPNTTNSATGSGALSSLSFRFQAVSPGISWRYIFASEEYPEFVGSEYNDRFSLSLNGENLALIPDTISPVAINSINVASNSAYYRSNSGTNLNLYNTQYDALTTVLTATKDNLIVGNEYTIEFLITDVGDSAWDSGVFIEANSIAFPGASPEEPLVPPDPVEPTSPWVFPTFDVFDPDFVWWLDPEYAVGYIYNVTGGPKFDEFTAPTLSFDNNYELFASADNSCSSGSFTSVLGAITGGTPFTFATPLECFAIKGIDVAGMLDPSDTNAFVGGISFDSVGMVNVTQTPIVVQVPGPLPVLGFAGAFAWSRRLRRRITA
jgi:hypothetical protein